MKYPREECPHCGETIFYTKDHYHGSFYNYFGATEEAIYKIANELYNASMFDGADYDYGKVAYCSGCHKALFKMSEVK